MAVSIFQQIEQRLDEHRIVYEVLRHQAVFTSQEAAEVRGTELGSGAKALICKSGEQLLMVVMPADHRLDSKAIRKQHQLKKIRFATKEEVFELSGLLPGSIPPFGSLFGLSTYCHRGLLEYEQINFNAGDHEISISMKSADYLRVENPTLGEYANLPEEK